MKNYNYCHLHNHTEYSVLDGVGTVKAYAARASELGFKYLACTDHGVMTGLIEFQKACDDCGISPILGCEGYIVPDIAKRESKRGHILLLVKNQTGFENLCRLLTHANLKGFYYRPRISYDKLLAHCEGLVISTACASSFLTMFDSGVSFFFDLLDKIGDDLYLEIMPHKLKVQKTVNDIALRLARKTRRKVIATNDCHYINRSEWKAQEVLLAIQTKAMWKDPKRFKFSIKNLHLRTANEMLRALRIYGLDKRKYLTNTIEIAEKCSDFRIPKRDILLPRVKGVSLKEKEFLWLLCIREFKSRFGCSIKSEKVYYRRLKEEYDLIIQKKFARYFLIVWELVSWCRKNKIVVGPGRGSIGGSLTAFLLGITAIDPIRHNLLFSRFINKDRIDYPDIDVDFEHSKRHLVKQHLQTMYGENHIANVSSFNRMKARAVIKDVSRVFDVPLGEVNNFTKLIEDNDEHTGIQEAIDIYEEGKQFSKDHSKIIKIAKVLEGQIRTYSTHAAALIISREPLEQSNRCNLIQRKDVLLINWEKDNAEHVGLMKLDALALKLLSVFGETKRLIKKNYGKDIDLDRINMEDKKVIKEINGGNTIGLFQMNTYAMTSLISELTLKDFKSLSDAVALVRPGVASSGMKDEYVIRQAGGSWDKHHKIYEAITKDTYGVIVYQEQVMEVIHKMAGLPYTVADKIRKIIGKKRDKKEFMPYKRKFINGCLRKKTFNRSEAKEFWRGLEKHAKYSFNRSHSVAYAFLGYQCAWLKKYYPTEFICASLTYGAKDKKASLIEEAYRLGLVLVLPKVGISDPMKWVAKGNKLYVPFIEIKNIGAVKARQAAEKVVVNSKIKNLFFAKKPVITKHKGSLGKILESVGAYKLNDDIQIEEKVKSSFDFRIITNPRDSYKNLYKLFGDKIRLDRIDKIISGDRKELRKLKKRAIRKVKFAGHDDLMSCVACELREECSTPVPPSPGRNNIVIAGEAPGFQEDREGEGFVGRSGDILWKPIKRKGYTRKDFHVTNINKCFVDPNIEIATSKGTKPISKIKVGNLVLTHKGKFKKVIWVQNNEFLYRRSKLIIIKYSLQEKTKKTKTIKITPEHPILVKVKGAIDYKWIKAVNINEGDKIKVLGKRCLECNKLFPLYSGCDFCTAKCSIVYRNKTRKWTDKDKLEVSKRMKRLYRTGILNRKSITKKANKANRNKVRNGTHHLLRSNRTVTCWNKGLTKYTSNKLKRASEKSTATKRKNGALKRFSEAGKEALRKYYKIHKRIIPRKNRFTKIEQVMAWALKERNLKDFVQNENIGSYYPDILFPQQKLVIECDGTYWHQKRAKTLYRVVRGIKRKKFFKKNKYTVLRFSEEAIEQDVFKCVDEVERVLLNHKNKYEFTEVKVVSIKTMVTSKPNQKLYNFGVKDHNSYIANGLVVHNCYPKLSGKPNRKQIQTCSKFIKRELKEIKPKVILAFGNTCLNFFTGQASGVTNVSGNVVWNEEYSSWIVWCIHPAATLHNPDSKSLFKESMKSFFHLIKSLNSLKK